MSNSFLQEKHEPLNLLLTGHFDYYNKTVLYEFGFGLSYTTFSIAEIDVQPLFEGHLTAALPRAKTVPGGNPHLWDTLYQVSVLVTNTGKVAGSAVPQLYLTLPRGPVQGHSAKRVLRGFEKVHLAPGQSEKVNFMLTRRDISYWDTVTQEWVIGTGVVEAQVGFSSRDFRASTSFVPLL